jgi:hypothetical protein
MAIPVMEVLVLGYKVRNILAKNKHNQRKLLIFENWCNGEMSKIEHHFSNKVI